MSHKSGKQAIVQMVYASAATVEFNDQDLESLLAIARKNNESLNVTGVLLFVDGTFFQVLEGASDVLSNLYAKIESDPRHDNVLLLAEQEIQERNFGQWSMGFLCNRSEILELPGFVDFFGPSSGDRSFLDLHGDPRRLRQILEGFRRGRWRRTAVESAH